MSHHLYLLDVPAAKNWAWVEFFFILSGYFITSHFSASKDENGSTILLYCFKKYINYLPYVFIAVVCRYLIDAFPKLIAGNYMGFIAEYLNFPFELLMLSSSGIVPAKLSPIWYLSTMFIMMPVFSWLLIPVLYYGKMGLNANRSILNDLLRCFAGMTLGSAVFYGVAVLKKVSLNSAQRVGATIVEGLALAGSIYIMTQNKNHLNLVLLFFILILLLQLSGITYSSCLRGKLFSFLAEMSLPLYLFHYNIGLLLNSTTLTLELKIIIYYSLSIALSALAAFLVDRFFRIRIRTVLNNTFPIFGKT